MCTHLVSTLCAIIMRPVVVNERSLGITIRNSVLLRSARRSQSGRRASFPWAGRAMASAAAWADVRPMASACTWACSAVARRLRWAEQAGRQAIALRRRVIVKAQDAKQGWRRALAEILRVQAMLRLRRRARRRGAGIGFGVHFFSRARALRLGRRPAARLQAGREAR